MNFRKNDIVAVSSLASQVKFGRIVSVEQSKILVSVGGNIIQCKPKDVTRIYEKNLIKRLKNEL